MKILNFIEQSSLVFHKDLCEAKHEKQSVFKFPDALFALKSDGPLVEASSGQKWYSVRSGRPELRLPPGRGIWWPRVVLLQVSLWVRLTFGQMYPPGRGIQWPRAVLSCI